MPAWAVAAAYGLMAVAVWSGATALWFNRHARGLGHDPWSLQPTEWSRRAGSLMCVNLGAPAVAVMLARWPWMPVSVAVYAGAVLVAWLTVRRWGMRLRGPVVWIVPGGTIAVLAVVALPFD